MTSLWKKLACKPQALNLEITLLSGQAFRWRKNNDEEWCGVLFGKVWTLKENENGIFYKVYESRQKEHGKCVLEDESILKDYFQLDVDLAELYKEWSKRDPIFKQVASEVRGFRLLRQDPVENLFSFICSSNNNIKRISTMVEALCRKYGDRINEIDDVVYHSFPTVGRLAESNVERELKEMKFGYRAKFIHETAKVLINKKKNWLMSLRNAPYAEAHAALCQFPGVGAKVADCVCLMSLDKGEAIPVDTHVWQISLRDYDIPELKKGKTLTERAYQTIGDHFRQLFGKHAGWANSVLFTADLKKIKSLKTPALPLGTDRQDKELKRKLCNSKSKTDSKKKK